MNRTWGTGRNPRLTVEVHSRQVHRPVLRTWREGRELRVAFDWGNKSADPVWGFGVTVTVPLMWGVTPAAAIRQAMVRQRYRDQIHAIGWPTVDGARLVARSWQEQLAQLRAARPEGELRP